VIRFSAVACAAVVLAGAVDAQAATGKPPNCRTGGTTLAANTQVRVFMTSRARPRSTIQTWWACDLARKRLHVLDSGGTNERDQTKGIFSLALNGRFAAYQQGVVAPGSGCSVAVVVFDVKRGRVLHNVRTGSGPCARKIIVTPRGDAAWTSTEEGSPVSVFAVDRTRPAVRLLDSGPDIDPASLNLDGPITDNPSAYQVSWMNGGEKRQGGLE
jgi:hypothetical protein